jgi:hypothetical protein
VLLASACAIVVPHECAWAQAWEWRAEKRCRRARLNRVRKYSTRRTLGSELTPQPRTRSIDNSLCSNTTNM